ncbi:ice-binding family protein [Flavobacterium sp. WC2421]|uniref:Ice-binding family protein n=1 Tax=Flavobacterium sp. WC2409 TaxID=3234139 RepID=A0AB39W3M8_9FLAO
MINSTQYKNGNSFLGIFTFISFLLLFGFVSKLSAQTAPNFGSVAKFVLFSGNGAVSNTGSSTLKGNVGANIGAVTGFQSPTTIDGTIENVNALTAQAALDLKAVCIQLQNTIATNTTHSTIYGNGETLVPGVYSAGAAASIAGTLTLDAQGNPNALFIFKIGGALTTAAGATVTLRNGAVAANVIWIANGAIAMAAGTTMNGTLIGYDGAVSMGAGGILNGRMFSNVGAVSVYGTIATIPPVHLSYSFLGPYTSDGTPQYFATSDVVNSSTIDLVKNSLPESFPVPVYNPQYISSGYDTDLVLEKAADVWVTFISEGAGYRNVLGFYTYDINNPPTTVPTVDQITIVFPNVSGAGSGGSLIAGNKVKIGTFTAGTGIGWVLLANGWDGTKVTPGLWQLFSNPNFNPEATAALRQHNVLLSDPANERIILGFEDIRRDYSSCDNDFNDAVFYVSANPFDAIRINNVADVSIAAKVTSGNNGGLESNGDLATLIAKRNFNRIKANSFADKKTTQKKFISSSITAKTSGSSVDFSTIIPNTGMFGTETTYVSSPTDLIGITNASQVYSVDYYEGDNRLAAVLATATTGSIYGHSKAICDRLNNSSLEDIRTINLNGYEIIMAKLKRANGEMEYALNFSIQDLGAENKLHSYWNIDQYPKGDYLNFQVWGSSMGQICSITNAILTKFQQQGTLSSDAVDNRIPTVFVKKGLYSNGKLYLTLINKSKNTNVSFQGNKKTTELTTSDFVDQNISLTGAYEEHVEVELGRLFDIGFSIIGDTSKQLDALYLADGPWGLDYSKTETTITSYGIDNDANDAIATDEYGIERNTSVTGELYGTLNVFRNILPGELVFDASLYSTVGFAVHNSLPIEVVLVTENTTDWNNRLRFQIPVNTSTAEMNILLDQFTNPQGQKYTNEKIKGIVFSVQGDYKVFQPFAVNVSQLTFKNASTLSVPSFVTSNAKNIYNYPNPCVQSTTIVLPKVTESAHVQIVDMTGRIVSSKNVIPYNNEITMGLDNLSKGVYLFIVTTEEKEQFQNKFLIN